MYVYVLTTLDTKGREAEFVCRRLKDLGVPTKLVDTGCLSEPTVTADISRDEVFRLAATSAEEMRQRGDRGLAVSRAAEGAMRLLRKAYQAGEVSGVLALGGSAGTTIGTTAMQALPLGVPKLMVSTLASGQTRPYVGDKDILMLNSVVDISGINRISGRILNEAAAAMAGMVRFRAEETGEGRPIVAATMFGVTTPCVEHARGILEDSGYEVLVFHATGVGGQAMESLIRDGVISGVLDITTTELADELVGGTLSAGPTRLTAAADCGVPQVVSVGALDMVNFGPRDTVPEKFQARRFHQHNPNVTLMRTTIEENAKLGEELAGKVNRCQAPAAVLLPLKGVSGIEREGQPFEDREARAALFRQIEVNVAAPVELVKLNYHINDPEFAEAAAHKLLELMRLTKK